MSNFIIITYTLYLLISIALTIWVAKTLHRNGRVFLLDTFDQNKDLTDSVNHLLVVGFYLVNIGFVCLFLKKGLKPTMNYEIFEVLSSKVGLVMLVLGGMHFLNLIIFSKVRKRALLFRKSVPVKADLEIDIH